MAHGFRLLAASTKSVRSRKYTPGLLGQQRLRRLLGLAVELGLRGRRDDVRLAGLLVPRPVLLREGRRKAKGEVGWRTDGLTTNEEWRIEILNASRVSNRARSCLILLTHRLAVEAAVLDDLAPRARLELLRIELLLAVRVTAPVFHGDLFLLLALCP